MKIILALTLLLGSAVVFGQAASSGDTTRRYPGRVDDRKTLKNDEVRGQLRMEENTYEKNVRKTGGTVPGEKVQDDAKDNEIGDNSTVPGKP
jgi:hypothetical protein